MKRAKMILKIYRNGEQVNEIKSTSKGEIFEHVARVYRVKLDKLAERVTIATGWDEIQHAEVYYNRDGMKWAYKYHFDGVRL